MRRTNASLILTRSAFPGAQRYAAATWSGDIGNDWETLRRQITAGLGYAASGMPYWTTDTGGFFRLERASTPTLPTTNASQMAPVLHILPFAACPRLSNGYGTVAVWGSGREHTRQYLDLRYRLLPYIYSEAAAVTLHGATLMRPLVMDFPDDQKALDQKYEYMFNPSSL